MNNFSFLVFFLLDYVPLSLGSDGFVPPQTCVAHTRASLIEQVNGEKQMGEWHVMLDACPHRSAPLSEGRVEEDGTLLCSYHAWRCAM
eukprot:3336522-Amphidinium_carterae.2